MATAGRANGFGGEAKSANMRRMIRWRAPLLAAFAAACATTPPASPQEPVEVQVLAFNDFHGALEPTPLPDGGLGGGAALLAARVKALRAPHSVVVSAGDLVGGSPLASGLFHDEGTIEAMNALGLDFAGMGNHELDEGKEEIRRLQQGGCHPKDGCQVSNPFPGAKFQFLGANIVERATGKTVFPPAAVRAFGGVRVGFIGLTLEDTPRATVSDMVKDLAFGDEVEAVNALVPGLVAEGARAVVVVIHQGGFQGSFGQGGVDTCDNFVGPIKAVAAGFDRRVAAVVSGHTHSFYNCVLDGRPVTSVGSRGHGLTDLRLRFGADGAFLGATAKNHLVDDAVPPDAAVAALVEKYVAAAKPVGARQVGTLAAPLTRKPSPGGDSAIGNVVTDAMLASAKGPPANAELALMNTSGLRADLVPGPGGAVSYAQAFEVQPFGNILLTVTVTGAELEQMLEASVGGKGKHLEVAGLTFRWNVAAPVGARVEPADVLVGGKPLALEKRYRVITNSILSDAVSGYAALGARREVVGGSLDLDAFSAWLSAHPNLAPPPQRVSVRAD